MPAPDPMASARHFTPELDVLRGLAAILMIVNHAGYRLLSTDDSMHSVLAPVVFLGSVAPAVFFFATGFGIGLSRASSRRDVDWPGVLWKAGLLVVADQFFYWGPGKGLGLDFFSFIALATLTISFISQFRQAVGICISLAAFLLILRYGLAPLLNSLEHPIAVVEWILGARAVVNVSYPLTPWMVFPLLGFACSFSYTGVNLYSPKPRNDWIKLGCVVAAFFCGSAFVLHLLNRGLFRWGTVSVAYFVFAVGVVVIAGLLSMTLVMSRSNVASALTLRGVASFAVIPLHYAMLELVSKIHGQPFSLTMFVLITACVAVLSFFASTQFAKVASRLMTDSHRRLLVSLFLGLVFVLALAINFDPPRQWAPAALMIFAAQVTIAALLGVRLPLRRV